MVSVIEEWRPVFGYEGHYSVSSLGRVRSEERMVVCSNGMKLPIKERILKTPLLNGYPSVTISKKRILVHRLVAEAFIPNPENKMTVNHIDGVKTNNHLSNLEWNTDSENQQHAIDVLKRTITKGVAHPKAKLTEFDVYMIRQMNSIYNLTQASLGKLFNVTGATIHQILNNKTWKNA